MPQFLYVLTPTRAAMLSDGPTPEEAQALGGHLRYLKQGAQEGTILLAGRTQVEDASTMGLVIFVAESQPAAEQIMQNDPAVKAGVMTGEVFPYQIAVLSDAIHE